MAAGRLRKDPKGNAVDVTSIRLTPTLKKHIDEVHAWMLKKTGLPRVSRTAVVETLLDHGYKAWRKSIKR